jgi:hypothetical protein
MIIREPTEAEQRAFWGAGFDREAKDNRVRDLKAAFIDGKPVGISGVMRDPAFHGSIFEEEGPWIGFFQIHPDVELPGAMIVVAMRQYLKQQREPILIQHDHRFPQAEKLLRILGFHPTHVMRPGLNDPSCMMRTWKWQPPQQSPL